MKAVAPGFVLLLIAATQTADAEQASSANRSLLAASIADYVRNGDAGKPGFFGANAVEAGAAAIEMPWSLADWRSADGAAHGQVLFLHICDQWNVAAISTKAFTKDHLVSAGVAPAVAAKLIADLSTFEVQKIRYAKPLYAKAHC